MTQAGLCMKTVLTSLSIASKYLEAFIDEIKPVKDHKRFLNLQLQKLNSIEMDFRHKSKDQQAMEIVKKETSENWEVLAVNNILLMSIDMSDEYRRKAEELIEGLYTEFINLQKREATSQPETDDNRNIR